MGPVGARSARNTGPLARPATKRARSRAAPICLGYLLRRQAQRHRARSGSSPRSTPPPAMPSAPWSPAGPAARDAAGFVDHVAERLAGIGAELTGVLTDKGPEFTGHGFTSRLEELGVRHHRIPPRSPIHNAVCERFQGTPSRSSTGRPSTSTFVAWPTWAPSSMAGCSTTTPAAPTAATSWAAARPLRSCRRTHHDQAKGPPVTSTRAQGGLGILLVRQSGRSKSRSSTSPFCPSWPVGRRDRHGHHSVEVQPHGRGLWAPQQSPVIDIAELPEPRRCGSRCVSIGGVGHEPSAAGQAVSR
jgi:hypothetical protein